MVARTDTAAPSPRLRRWPYAVLATALVVAAAAGAGLGYFLRFNLPDVRALEDYRPPVMTQVLDVDGNLIETFAEQHRILIGYGEIPQVFLQALLAVEDSNFLSHTGIDLRGVARALWRDVTSLSMAQGASTLTQQLARDLFLHRDKTIRRKLQEAFLAVEIERQYTKEEILRFYCNQIYMGHGRYGIEAASRFYFGHPARELGLTEAALLAGVIQRPEALSPLRHADRALSRRNHVLRRMAEVSFLSAEEAEVAAAAPLGLSPRVSYGDLAPHFVEEVRRWLQERYGSSDLYRAGLAVRTTLDPRLQVIANRALDHGLRELDKRQGWRGPTGRIPVGEDPLTWQAPGWREPPPWHGVEEGLVVSVDARGARVRVRERIGHLAAADLAWTGRQDPQRVLKRGDLVRVRTLGATADGQERLALEQEPRVEGALVALDPATGAVRALCGGLDFGRSEFNRAIQARRQTGSAFKPFVYATALSVGWTLADTVLDEPTVFLDPQNPEPYQPENYGDEYHGTLTLRRALEQSANVATVKLLDRIGYDAVIDTARRLGITGDLRAYPSLGLGAFETSLLELTSAYGAIANAGVLVQAHLIDEVLDQSGTTIERMEPQVRDALTPQIAYLMTQVLQGVITDGTGRAAADMGFQVAGKTGTTDENTDAWFVGFTPGLAVGVWVGFDEPRPLGRRETGAQAALPIWEACMRGAFADAPPREEPPPSGIALAAIDRRTGLRANAEAQCEQVFSEVFLAGTEPTEPCGVVEHRRLRLDYPWQRYSLNETRELQVPADELAGLLEVEAGSRVVDEGRRLEVLVGPELVSIPLRILPASGRQPGDDPRLSGKDTSAWRGKDGRPAAILWLGEKRKARPRDR